VRSSVILANARIQNVLEYWIPAFAGMMPEAISGHFAKSSSSVSKRANDSANQRKTKKGDSMWETFINFILMRSRRARKAAQAFMETLESEGAEEFLELLLKLMGLVFWLDKDFRRNIEDFNGRYLFRSRDRQITVSAVFKDNRLKVSEKEIDDTHMTVVFRNAKALMGFLLSPKPDILGSMLRQDITIDGNLNYLYKFAYMAKHLQLKATGAL
jgi:hypothetical protein